MFIERHMSDTFEALKRFTTLNVADGALICTYDKLPSLNGKDMIVPVSYI